MTKYIFPIMLCIAVARFSSHLILHSGLFW